MKTKIIFLGNGPLANFVKETLLNSDKIDIVFHARTKDDLETVKRLKTEDPSLEAVLASFGVMIKSDLLELFEPNGILNVHPSLLPRYRGASPIESAILNGDKDFSVSVMKLVKAMDAGPIYFQTTLTPSDLESFTPTPATTTPLFPDKTTLYRALATTGASWITENITNLPTPTEQDDKNATFTEKFDTSLSELTPDKKPAIRLLNEIRAFENFPKSRYTFNDIDCIILEAHVTDNLSGIPPKIAPLCLKCVDNNYLIIDRLQPAGRKPMDAKSFVNGYLK